MDDKYPLYPITSKAKASAGGLTGMATGGSFINSLVETLPFTRPVVNALGFKKEVYDPAELPMDLDRYGQTDIKLMKDPLRSLPRSTRPSDLPTAIKAYRADPTGKFGGKEGLETLPIQRTYTGGDQQNPRSTDPATSNSYNDSAKAVQELYRHARLLGAAQKHGHPTFTPEEAAAFLLKEGRTDLGHGGVRFGNKREVEFDDMLKKTYNLHPEDQNFLAAINAKKLVADRLGISLAEAWNGTGRNEAGQTGKDYAKNWEAQRQAALHPKNKELLDLINRAINEGKEHGLPLRANRYRDEIMQRREVPYANGGIIHKAEGGSMDTPSLAQMRVQLNQRKNPDYIDSIGIEQAVDMNPKKYMTPNPSSNDFMPVGGVADGNGLPVGGIDQDNAQQGQQMMPQQDQDMQPNPSPLGTPPSEQEGTPQQKMGNMLSMTPQGQALQAMGQPPGMARGGKVDRRPFENSVQRNLRQLKNGTYNVSMTPEEKMKEQIRQRLLQEKAMKESMAKGGKVSPKQMAAIKAKMMMKGQKKYAKGGNVEGTEYEQTDNPKRILFRGKGHGDTQGIIVPRHMWEGSQGTFSKGAKQGQTFKNEGMRDINKARAEVYGAENRDPLNIGQVGRVHKKVLDEHFAKPLSEQIAAENEALGRLRKAKHIGDGANTLDESEKLDTVRHERDEKGRAYVGYASKGVAGHSLYTSGHGENAEHHIINTCPGQTVGCGGGHDENGIIDTTKGTCFAPNAEAQYVNAAIRRASHEQAKHDPKMTRDWILAHTGSLRQASNNADKKNLVTLFRPNVVDETDVSSRHVIKGLNEQRKAAGKPNIIANSYGKTNELHDPENGYYVTHSNIGPKTKHGAMIADNVARDKQRVRSTITAMEGNKDLKNEQGNLTPPKNSYMVTDVKRGSPMSKQMEKHIKYAKYWSTGRHEDELSKEEKAEGEEGHFDGNGKPTTEDKAHFGHITFDGKRYDYQKQHILHPRLVQVGNNDDGTPHMIPTDSRFKDDEFLPKNRFKTKNGKIAGAILMTTPTESTSNHLHHSSFTHHVGEHNIEYAKQNKGEYEIDSPMHQAMAEGKEYTPPQPIKIVRKASGGSIARMKKEYDDDFNCFPERNFMAQHHLANRAGVEDETELPASLLQRPKD